MSLNPQDPTRAFRLLHGDRQLLQAAEPTFQAHHHAPFRVTRDVLRKHVKLWLQQTQAHAPPHGQHGGHGRAGMLHGRQPIQPWQQHAQNLSHQQLAEAQAALPHAHPQVQARTAQSPMSRGAFRRVHQPHPQPLHGRTIQPNAQSLLHPLEGEVLVWSKDSPLGNFDFQHIQRGDSGHESARTRRLERACPFHPPVSAWE